MKHNQIFQQDDDDGFILDDPANNMVSAQPLKEFDELELWRRYQKDGNEVKRIN